MITQCNNKSEILEYIGNDYYKCLYLYIDLEKYGANSDCTKTWIIRKEDTSISAVLLNYENALHVFSRKNDFNIHEIEKIVQDVQPTMICATKETIQTISLLMKYGYILEYGFIGRRTAKPNVEITGNIERTKLSDIKEVASLLFEDEGIGASYTLENLIEQITNRLKSGFIRSYVIRDKDKIVAHLSTGGEVPRVCTVSYTITAPSYRGRGYAKSLYDYVCNELSKEGMEVFAVYYVPEAINLHHKMGFVDVCDFAKLYKKTH